MNNVPVLEFQICRLLLVSKKELLTGDQKVSGLNLV